MESIRYLVSTLLIVLSATFPIAAASEANPEEIEVNELRKEMVKKSNSEWQKEYEIYRARAKEAEKRGEFSSVSPPKILRPFKDWDYYYLDGDSMGWFPNKGQEYEKVIVPIGFVTDLASIPNRLLNFSPGNTGPDTIRSSINY